MSEVSVNNKRIAKNTLILYIRVFFSLIVSLYTSRVVLQQLGIEDYGIYNVIGGIVILFSFLNNAMSNATQRFITYSIGIGNRDRLKNVFSTAVMIHLSISLLIVLLAETLGLYFLYNYLVIPAEKMNAALIVFHLSVLSAAIGIMTVPYISFIIAHERMGFFASMSIFETSLKLLIAISLSIFSNDKLIWYVVLLTIVPIIIVCCYASYCKKSFKEAVFIFPNNKCIYKEMMGFASWSLIGNLSIIGCTQGVNMILNIFYGPAMNASRGIAVQIQNAVYSFVQNFQTAINPQITKSYAKDELQEMHRLVGISSRFSFYLMLFIAVPFTLNVNYILNLWLELVPNYSEIFSVIIMFICLLDAIQNPFMIAVSATGVIKKYHLFVGSLMLSIVPISYFTLKMGFPPYSVFLVHLFILSILFFVRLHFANQLFSFNIRYYLKHDVSKMVLVTFIVGLMSVFLFIIRQDSFIYLMISTFISILFIAGVIYCMGLTRNERNMINFKIKHYYEKVH